MKIYGSALMNACDMKIMDLVARQNLIARQCLLKQHTPGVTLKHRAPTFTLTRIRRNFIFAKHKNNLI
jgi:hypothetical protein